MVREKVDWGIVVNAVDETLLFQGPFAAVRTFVEAHPELTEGEAKHINRVLVCNDGTFAIPVSIWEYLNVYH